MDCNEWRDVDGCPPKSNALWWQEWRKHYVNCLSCRKWAEEFRRRNHEVKSSMNCSKFRESTEADFRGQWKTVDDLTDDELEERNHLLRALGDHQDKCAECTRWLDHFLSSTDWGKRAEGETAGEGEMEELLPNPLEDPKNAHRARDIYLIVSRFPLEENALRVVRGGSA